MVQRVLCFRDRAGRETTLRSRRFVSMAQSHRAGIEWTLTPQNWSGRVEVISGLDGRVTNQMVARYRELEGGGIRLGFGHLRERSGYPVSTYSVGLSSCSFHWHDCPLLDLFPKPA